MVRVHTPEMRVMLLPVEEPTQVWDDGRNLDRAVDRLEAARRGLAELVIWRRSVNAVTRLTLGALAVVALSAFVTACEACFAAGLLSSLVLMARSIALGELDVQIRTHREEADHRCREVGRHLDATDWMLNP